MNTTMASRTAYRPRPLTADQQRKVDAASAHLAKREKIERIRAGLRGLIDAGERELVRRRLISVGGGQDIPQLLIDAIAIETDFEALVARDLK